MGQNGKELGRGTAYVGIDPGKSGYVVRLNPDGGVESWPTPTVLSGKGKAEYDVPGMIQVLTWALAANGGGLRGTHVVIEKQQAFPGQGGTSNFTTGRGFGLWEGIVASLGAPYTVVHPRTWRALLTRDAPGTDDKQRSILVAGRLFPGVNLLRTDRCRNPDHNLCDALLLAEYGRRTIG